MTRSEMMARLRVLQARAERRRNVNLGKGARPSVPVGVSAPAAVTTEPREPRAVAHATEGDAEIPIRLAVA